MQMMTEMVDVQMPSDKNDNDGVDDDDNDNVNTSECIITHLPLRKIVYQKKTNRKRKIKLVYKMKSLKSN